MKRFNTAMTIIVCATMIPFTLGRIAPYLISHECSANVGEAWFGGIVVLILLGIAIGVLAAILKAFGFLDE